jgi:DUF971 family protein
MIEASPWPTRLHFGGQGQVLEVSFDSGRSYALAAELLRVESPSAEVKGHGPGQEQLVFGKRGVFIVGAEPVGNYAIRLKFSDGHMTGIFTWSYLEKLGRESAELWAAYEDKLRIAGLSR